LKFSRQTAQALYLLPLALAATTSALSAEAAPSATIHWHCRVSAGQTQIDFDLPGKLSYHYFSLAHPHRLVIDLDAETLPPQSAGKEEGCGDVSSLHWAKRGNGTLRYVLVLTKKLPVNIVRSPAANGQGLLLSARLGNPGQVSIRAHSPAGSPQHKSQPPQALLKVNPGKGQIVIAIDPGHGGSDPGTRGPRGLKEKTVTLAIARMLAKKIDATHGLAAFLTRDSDRYVGLRRRVLDAQKQHADLFISIHANAYPRVPRVRGGAVYALSEHGASNAEAGLLARTENAADPTIGDIHFAPHNPLVNSALTHMAQRASIANGSQLGADVLRHLAHYEPLYEHHVQYANFEVLRDPVIPSILVETAFLSNPHQARELHTKHFREELANAIYLGIREFLKSHDLSPVQLVRRKEKNRAAAKKAARILAGKNMHAGNGSAYRVRSGDTLSGVALRLHVSQWRLEVYNHLHSRRLKTGQVLKVPPSTFDYKVRPGDNLSVIAAKADVTMKALKDFNGLDNNQLTTGQVLTLPPRSGNY